MKIEQWRFEHLHPSIGRLIRSWIDRARERRGCTDEEAFEPFILCYIAFNAWGATVTNCERDLQIIQLLGSHEGLQREFDALSHTDSNFKQNLTTFRQQWPILKVAALRKQHIQLPPRGAVEWADTVRRLPVTFELAPKREEGRPTRIGEDFEPSWSNTLDAIYRVRCNLFHGEKVATSESDSQIVGAAFRVLLPVFERFLGVY